MTPRRSRIVGSAGLAAAALWLAMGPANAAPVPRASTSELKAAFVLNFVRFTEWPSEAIAGSSPIVVCLADDTGVVNALQQLVRGRTAASRTIEVRWTKKDDDFRACHVAYLSGVDAKRSAALVAQLQGTPTLTISDDEAFAERGGIANFFVEHDNMGFAVNMAALQRANLQMSAKLLSLARIVRK